MIFHWISHISFDVRHEDRIKVDLPGGSLFKVSGTIAKTFDLSAGIQM